MKGEKRESHCRTVRNHLILNPAFLAEIKDENFQFKQLLQSISEAFKVEASIQPRMLSELLSGLRDAIETYFALEEFYGYMDVEDNTLVNPQISQQVQTLRDQHKSLFIELSDLIEESDRIVYHEIPFGRSISEIIEGFFSFYASFQEHEQREMELAMRLANEEIGVGD